MNFLNPSVSTCNISVSPYQLVPKSVIGSFGSADSPEKREPRRGALLKFQFKDGQTGYADCFPWPELGDQPLGVQLERLKEGDLTALTLRSYEFAKLDAEGRSKQRSLWEHSKIPASHALIADVQALSTTALMSLAARGFTHIKIKLGFRNPGEASFLAGFTDICKLLKLKIRLDFNSVPSPGEVEMVLKDLTPIFPYIDFIEDPCPYDPSVWIAIQNKWKVRLAMDRMPEKKELVEGSFSVVILKPAIQNPDSIMLMAHRMDIPVVVTSYLDHPLGQLGAAWVAASLSFRYHSKVEVCGLLSHFAYEETSFSSLLTHYGPNLLCPSGTGFGFDQALSALEWKPL